LAPERRAVRLETTGCGFAAGRTGSGVAVGGGRVITVAHLVVQADGIVAAVGGADPVDAAVIAVDLERDLAVLRVPSDDLPTIETAGAGRDASGRIVGAATSGTIPFTVEDVVSLTIEEVLGTERHSRAGYALEAATADGDSGAGAYDDADRLIGIVFATGEDGETSWVTAASEIEDFLGRSAVTPLACDPAISRLALP
jgi:S1-C subfamily serine protease